MKNPILMIGLLAAFCGTSISLNEPFENSVGSNLTSIQPTAAFRTITFPSQDGIQITADLYEISREKPYILLCHQAGYSRGEYRQTALNFIRMGYNCLAIDQRSGDKVNGVVNMTAKAAVERGLPTGYMDAKKDIVSSINFLNKFTTKPIILMGSSYSASLALIIAAKHNKVGAVISYSPGEYFKGVKIADELKGFSKSTYVTSSKAEAKEVSALLRNMNPEYRTQFIPKGEGDHGSKVLWYQFHGQKEYWKSLKDFLNELQDN